MRNILILFTLIFSGFVSAQTFDFSCATNTAPELLSITVEIDGRFYDPVNGDEVITGASGQQAVITVIATDADGDDIKYRYSALGGVLTTSHVANYTLLIVSDQASTTLNFTVSVEDGTGDDTIFSFPIVVTQPDASDDDFNSPHTSFEDYTSDYFKDNDTIDIDGRTYNIDKSDIDKVFGLYYFEIETTLNGHVVVLAELYFSAQNDQYYGQLQRSVLRPSGRSQYSAAKFITAFVAEFHVDEEYSFAIEGSVLTVESLGGRNYRVYNNTDEGIVVEYEFRHNGNLYTAINNPYNEAIPSDGIDVEHWRDYGIPNYSGEWTLTVRLVADFDYVNGNIINIYADDQIQITHTIN